MPQMASTPRRKTVFQEEDDEIARPPSLSQASSEVQNDKLFLNVALLSRVPHTIVLAAVPHLRLDNQIPQHIYRLLLYFHSLFILRLPSH